MIRYKKLLILLSIIGVLVVLNILSRVYSFRLDLTEEKRYTLSIPTRKLLQHLEDPITIDVYLYGDLPTGFKRLQQSIEEHLENFQSYGGKKIQFMFFDPLSIKDTKAKNNYIRNLSRKGIQPTTVFEKQNGKQIEKLIFPGAVISYKNREVAVMLLKGNKGNSPQEILNQSIENIEYELASAIKLISQEKRKKIGWIEGHGELTGIRVADIANTINERYDLFRINLPNKKQLVSYDLLIIAKPTQPFSEADQYKLDQYIMNGGNVIFLIDEIRVDLDSVGTEGTFAFTYNHGLDDMLFRYGVRVNPNLIQDLYAGAQPVVVGLTGNQPQIQLLPWPFFPIINSFGNNPAVKNLDAILLKFASSIDTVKAKGIRKTPLLFTSLYSRTLSSPIRINFNDMRKELQPTYLNKGPFVVAYLIEGSFQSAFKNRILPTGIDTSGFKKQGIFSKLIICSDGDIVRNELDPTSYYPLPNGFDPYTKNTFANKDFILNTVDYLLDSDGLIVARKKEIKLRPLDKVKISNEKWKWQLLNALLPVLIIIIAGIAHYGWRKIKFEKNKIK